MFAPVQGSALKHIGRHAIDALFVELALELVVECAALAARILRKSISADTCFLKAVLHHLRVLDIKLAPPETREHIHQETAHSRPLRLSHPKHCDVDQLRIPDLLGPLEDQALPLGISARIGIGIFDRLPGALAARLRGDDLAILLLGRAKIAGNVERKRSPVEFETQLAFKRQRRLDRNQRVGAFDIDIDNQRSIARKHIHDPAPLLTWCDDGVLSASAFLLVGDVVLLHRPHNDDTDGLFSCLVGWEPLVKYPDRP